MSPTVLSYAHWRSSPEDGASGSRVARTDGDRRRQLRRALSGDRGSEICAGETPSLPSATPAPALSCSVAIETAARPSVTFPVRRRSPSSTCSSRPPTWTTSARPGRRAWRRAALSQCATNERLARLSEVPATDEQRASLWTSAECRLQQRSVSVWCRLHVRWRRSTGPAGPPIARHPAAAITRLTQARSAPTSTEHRLLGAWCEGLRAAWPEGSRLCRPDHVRQRELTYGLAHASIV
jgi:hypothetical protein